MDHTGVAPVVSCLQGRHTSPVMMARFAVLARLRAPVEVVRQLSLNSMDATGFEPAIPCLRSRCLPVRLRARHKFPRTKGPKAREGIQTHCPCPRRPWALTVSPVCPPHKWTRRVPPPLPRECHSRALLNELLARTESVLAATPREPFQVHGRIRTCASSLMVASGIAPLPAVFQTAAQTTTPSHPTTPRSVSADAPCAS